MQTWREEQKVDEIVATVLPRGDEFKKIWPSGTHGFGKAGNLIYVDRVGQVEPSKLTGKNGFTMDEVQRFHIQMMEGVNRQKELQYAATGSVKYKNLVILDLDGLGMGHMGSKFTGPMKSFIKIDQVSGTRTTTRASNARAGAENGSEPTEAEADQLKLIHLCLFCFSLCFFPLPAGVLP